MLSKLNINRFSQIFTNVEVSSASKISDTRIGAPRRIFWLVLVSAATGFLCFHIYKRLKFFSADPTLFQNLAISRSNLPLPGITICSSNVNFGTENLEVLCIQRFGIYTHRREPCVENIEVENSIIARILREITWCKRYNFGTLQANTSGTGSLGGLQIVIKIGGEEAISHIEMMLHAENDVFIPVEKANSFGIDLGTKLDIGMRRHDMQWIKNCQASGTRYSNFYHTKGCALECMVAEMRRQCNCDYHLDIHGAMDYFALRNEGDWCRDMLDTEFDEYTEEYGNIWDPKFEKDNTSCVYQMIGNPPRDISEQGLVLKENCLASCKQACKRVDLNPEMVVSTIQKNIDLKDPLLSAHVRNVTNQTISSIRSRVALVNIFYSTMEVTKMIEVRQFDWLAILSDLGGTLGIVYGGCLFTLVELIEGILVTIAASSHKKQREGTRRQRHSTRNSAKMSSIHQIGPIAESPDERSKAFERSNRRRSMAKWSNFQPSHVEPDLV